MENKHLKMKKKIGRMHEEIENYRIVSNRHISFLYSLKLKNIDIDRLYDK